MPYSVEYDPQTAIIYIKADGELTLENIREYTKAAALLAKEQGCVRILTDMREATIHDDPGIDVGSLSYASHNYRDNVRCRFISAQI